MNEKNKKILIGVIIGLCLLLILIFFLIKGCVKEYTVTFDSNGGTSVESMKVKENEKITKPENPTKTGYVFDGWYLNDELFDFDTKITKDITLKAYWTVNGIELSSENINLVLGSEQKLKILSLPDGITEKDLIYSSSDESIVTVDKNGNLKALKTGNVTITIKTKDGKYETLCKINVTEKAVEVESVSIDGYSTVTVGSSIKLNVTFNPSDTTDQKVTWKSSDTSIATVDENGRVKGLKAGKVTITVTTSNGKESSKTITVENQKEDPKPTEPTTPSTPSEPTPSTPTEVKVTNITIKGNGVMDYGSSQTLSVEVLPGNANNRSVTWSVTSGATIDANGKIQITGEVDEVTVTATAKDGSGVKATFTIKINSKYVITLKHITLDSLTNQKLDYEFSVTKNGKPFSDYIGFKINDHEIAKSYGKVADMFVTEGTSNAEITLNNGSKVQASVVIVG